MIEIEGYRITEQIYKSSHSVIYRGEHVGEKRAVVLKKLKNDYPTVEELAGFRREYETTRSFDLDGIVRVIGLEKYRNTLVMVLEDFAGQSLADLIPKMSYDLAEFLQLSVHLAEILGQIHRQQVMHKDINPSNIIWNPRTDQIKIIDFGISTALSRENPEVRNPDAIEGTLAYISPEQTGRMNRAMDYRTDFYSLGVAFYEMLTRRLPFETQDAMELVHAHLAKTPPPPSALKRDIPKVVSDIVSKLMAKKAEERYQSAFGLKSDLQLCLDRLRGDGTLEAFEIGRRDTSERFQIPQKLYGREKEIETLLQAFQRVRQGGKETMLAIGDSGIGKSALVYEVFKPITEKQGYFISGKFDPFQRNVPYASLIQAFQGLVRQLLTENERNLATWKTKLLKAVGPNGQIVVDVIPEMELILGKQPAIPELPATESQNRFNLVFQNFMRVFASEGRPLILFLDDLQWADAASLKLIELLMADLKRRHILMVGAYREADIDTLHPWPVVLENLRKAGADVDTIALQPLVKIQVNRLVSETLACDPSVSESLSNLCFEKTRGHPFFLIQFLTALYEDRLIDFDTTRGIWHWDVKRIQEKETTDNVVELMVGKLQKLPETTRNLLSLAACIGAQFELPTLATVNGKSWEETADELWESLQEGLVVPTNDAYKLVGTGKLEPTNGESVTPSEVPTYRFQHNRIQQVAYSFLSNDRQQYVHLTIGRLLLNRIDPEQSEEKIFDIVNQLNSGADLITDPEERDRLTRLNLTAGRRAKDSAAYEVSLNYLSTGLELLDGESWQKRYETALALHTEAAEAAYFCADFDRLDSLGKAVFSQARTLIDKIKIHELEILRRSADNRPLEAIEAGLLVLKEMGVYLPKAPNLLHIVWGLVRIKLALIGKPIDELNAMEDMTRPDILAALRILDHIGQASYFALPRLLPLIVMQYFRLSLKYGHSPATAFGFAGYGMMLSGVLERFEAGCRFGELALSVGERPSARNSRSKTWFLVETTIRHWKNPLRETLKPLLQAYRFGLETGDIEYALFSAHTHCVYSLFAGEPLPEIADKMSDFRRIMIQFDQKTTLNIFEIYRQTILNLTEQSEDPCRFDGDAYREDEMLPIHRGANDNTALFLMYFNKLTLCYLFGRHKQAVGHAETAEKYLESVTGSYQVPLYYFYDSLARLGALSGTGKAERRRYLKKIARDRKKMRKWARHAPMNFQHKYYLMEAERSRVLGRNQQALDCYDRAIASAGENEYLQEEALANELAAGFWLEKDKGEVAAVYLQKAHYFYGLWGANRKVEYLEERHPFLSASRELATNGTTRHTIQSPGTATTKMSTVSGALDTKTIMKVSQSLTKEVHLEKLLENIIRLVMENAGATKGILMTDEDGSLRVRVKGEAAGETIDTMHAMPVEDYDDIPLSIVNYTARTQTPVVLNDAPRNATYGTDTYIRTRQPKSVLCMPIVHLAKLRGILYLENDLATGAFTPDSLELLKILSSQAAISMENTHYYKSLEESEKKFRSLYERAVEGIFQTSVNGNLIGVNPALVRILGYDSEEDLLAGIADFTRQPFVTADDREEFGNLLLEKGQAVGFETQMYRKDQSVIWISLSAQFVEDDSGKAPHYEGLLLDVTERKQREEAERLRKVAEAATRSKSDFLANMSHEIRTPLNAILGMAELLSETELSIEQKDYVRTFQSSGEQLLSIINDILDFSKIEAGQIELESIPFDLTELAENVCKILAVQAHAKGLELACRIAPQVHTFRLGDPTHLRQILTNLIGNAVKFTRKGEVVLEVVPEQDTAVPDRLRFCVRDTGIGIPLERRETLFEGFSQADTSTSRKFGGTGLGLTISKRLVGLMGGKIWIESEVGQGSRFIFNAELPRTDPLPTSTFAPPNDLEGLKILVVDANATNRLVLRERLLDWGAHVEEVKSGEEALDQLKLSENQGATYGLVLLDFNIPGLDGFQVAEQVDLLPLTDPPPIIMLTSSEGIGNRILAGKLKLAGYLVKPVKREDLLESIRTALGGKETVSKPTPPVETVVLPPMRILLAEDIEANWKIIKLFLKETPVTIDIAENGRIAVEKYRAEKHDLVLMDIQMPEMDGYEATRRIRSWEDETGVAPVPIIALTAHAFKQRQQESYEAGCDDFLTKPVKKKKLLEKIGALHQVKTESEALGASTDDRLALPEEISSHVVSPQTPAKKSRPKVRIDAFLKELIPDFLQDANQELKNMRSALENSDFETLNRLGHGFKGASGNYELDDLAEIFLAMEKAAAAQDPETAGRNLKKAAEYLEQVEIEFTEE